jgi:hypothetical protein
VKGTSADDSIEYCMAAKERELRDALDAYHEMRKAARSRVE